MSSAPAQAAPARLGVVVQLAVNLDGPSAEAIAQTLAEVIREERKMDVIAGEAASRRLPADGVAPDCLARPACLQDVGERLSAEQLILLVLVKLGDGVQLDATWVDAATQRTVPRPAVSLPNEGAASQRKILRAALDDLLPPTSAAVASIPETSTATVGVATAVTQPGKSVGWPTIILGGASVTALAIGAGFGVSSLRQRARLDDDECRSVACDPDRVDRLERSALVADVLIGVGLGAGLAAGILYYLQPEEGGTTVTVAPVPGGAWVGVGGRL